MLLDREARTAVLFPTLLSPWLGCAQNLNSCVSSLERCGGKQIWGVYHMAGQKWLVGLTLYAEQASCFDEGFDVGKDLCMPCTSGI